MAAPVRLLLLVPLFSTVAAVNIDGGVGRLGLALVRGRPLYEGGNALMLPWKHTLDDGVERLFFLPCTNIPE